MSAGHDREDGAPSDDGVAVDEHLNERELRPERADASADAEGSLSEREPAEPVESLLAHLVRGLVDEPEKVLVERFEGDGEILLELSVAPDDYGKVIGKGGRTAQALRTVVRAAAASRTRRVLVDIVD